jgi:hypothetical protein
MPVTETSDSLIFLQVAENDMVILKYDTCTGGPVCEDFVPVYLSMSADVKYKDIVFLTIDAEENPVAKRRILDKKQPVITVYSKGRLLDSRHASTREGVEQLLDELLLRSLVSK